MKAKKSIIAGLLLIGACLLTILVGTTFTGHRKNAVNSKIDLEETLAETIEDAAAFEAENVNLSQGGLLAFSQNKIYFADLSNGGVLSVCNIGEEEYSYALTDYPVANISVREDRILFTDITGTFYTGFDEKGSEVIRVPEEAYTMEMYLADKGLTERINWGGSLCYAGIASYAGDASEVALEDAEISGDGMYYSPRMTPEQDVIALCIPKEVYLSRALSNILLASADASLPSLGAEAGKSFMQYLKEGIAGLRDTALILRPGEQPTGDKWIREIPNFERKDGEVPVTDGRIELFGDGYFALELAAINPKTEETEYKIAFYNLQDKNEDNCYKQLSVIEGGKNLIVKDGQLFYLNEQGDIMRHDPQHGTEPLLAGQNVKNMFLNGNGDFELTLPVLDSEGNTLLLPAVMKEGTWVEKLILSELEGERGIYYTIPGQETEGNPFFTDPMQSSSEAYTIIADFNTVKKLAENNIAYYRDAASLSDVYYRIKKLKQVSSGTEQYQGIGFVLEKNENYDPRSSLGEESFVLLSEEEMSAAVQTEEKKEEKKEENKKEKKEEDKAKEGANPYFPGLPYTPSDSYYFYPKAGEENTFAVSICSPYVFPAEYAGWFLMGAKMDEVFEEKDSDGYYLAENQSDLMQWDGEGKNCRVIRKVSFLHSYAADNMQKFLEEGVSGITYRTPAKKKRQLEENEYIRTGDIIYYCYEMSGYDKPWDDRGIAQSCFLGDLSGTYQSTEEGLEAYRANAPDPLKEETLAYGVFADRELYDLFADNYYGSFSWYYADKPGEITASNMTGDGESTEDGKADAAEDGQSDAENADASSVDTSNADASNAEEVKEESNPEQKSPAPWIPVKRIILEGRQYPGPRPSDNPAAEGNKTEPASDKKDKEPDDQKQGDEKPPSEEKSEEEDEEEEKKTAGFRGDKKLSADPDGMIDGEDYIWDLTFEDLDPDISGLGTSEFMFQRSIEEKTEGTPYSDEQIEAYWANRARGSLVSDKFTEEEITLLAGITICTWDEEETGDLSEILTGEELAEALTGYYLYADKTNPNRIQFKFYEDGTYYYTDDAYDSEAGYTGTYTVEGNVLRTHREDQDYESEYYMYILPYHSIGGPRVTTQNTLWLQSKNSIALVDQYHGIK